jgi:predicted glycoside hydrolase/deacetylase ChbG (UPF0249 family)
MQGEAVSPAEAPGCVRDHHAPDARSRAETGPQLPAIVIVNADDWGINAAITDCILACARPAAISSVSAMVFMDDSERAARLARDHGIDAGLHLNLTCAFTATGVAPRLLEHHRRIVSFLRLARHARVLFNPLLVRSFDYVTRAQLDEFERLYGAPPRRVDGHHHMHLCTNVLVQKLLPKNAMIRRNQHFAPGEMSALNRRYRRWQDRFLARRYPTSDYFFDLSPMQPKRLRRILTLARESTVEIAAHPDGPEEFAFLMSGGLARCAENVSIAPRYVLPPSPKRDSRRMAESGS